MPPPLLLTMGPNHDLYCGRSYLQRVDEADQMLRPIVELRYDYKIACSAV